MKLKREFGIWFLSVSGMVFTFWTLEEAINKMGSLR